MERQPIHFFNNVAEVRRMPTGVIADVVVNDRLRDGVSRNVLPWLNEDYLVQNAGYFAFADGSGAIRPQGSTMLRALINDIAVEQPFFDEFGNGYSMVTSKGIGLSRFALNLRASGFGPSNVREHLLQHSDPHGFFGFRHARQDMEISNELAARGGRVLRALAILVIDHKQFRKWAEQVMDRASSYPCLEMLDRVETNDDTAAILVRMIGADKLYDLTLAKYGLYSPFEVQKRAAQTLYGEVSSRGESQFVDRFSLGQYVSFKTKPLIESLRQEANGKGDFWALRFFAGYFHLWNIAIKKSVSDEKFGGTLTVQLSAQNVDVLGYWGDFETGIKNDPQYLLDSITSLGSEYLQFNYPFKEQIGERARRKLRLLQL